MYYLQSRYYDPEVCRFINADEFASTGQGFVGYNMFAYCNNNPVIYVDSSGGKPKFWEYWIIHKRVQEDVAYEHGFALEVRVDSGGSTGYLDIYDPYTNTYYEVKSVGQVEIWLSGNQKTKYESSYINDWRFRGDFPDSPTPGTLVFAGEVQYKDYTIKYETYIGSGSNELIVYTVTGGESQNSIKISNAGIAGAVVLGTTMTLGIGLMLPGSREPLKQAIK